MTRTSRRRALGLLGAAALVPAVAVGTASARERGQRSGPSPDRKAAGWETVVPETSFASYSAFEQTWNYLYPWGNTHNGGAKMYGSPSDHSQVSLANNELTLKATRLAAQDGTSPHPPNSPIWYRSGAVHAKPTVVVNDEFPTWVLKGEFRTQTGTGIWPAFWITGADGVWPPEADILEYVGDSTNLMNTWNRKPDGSEPDKAEFSNPIPVDDPDTWHRYRVELEKIDANDVGVNFYFDDVFQGDPDHHLGRQWVGVPMQVILNLQMESYAGTPGPSGDTYFRARNLSVTRYRA